MRVYISGQITDNDDYMEQFERAQAELEGKGYKVLNPAATCATLPPGTKYEEFMSIAFKLLDMADAIYMLQTWTNSKGANRKYGYALGKNKEIMYE